MSVTIPLVMLLFLFSLTTYNKHINQKECDKMDFSNIVKGFKNRNFNKFIDELNKKLENIEYILYRYILIES